MYSRDELSCKLQFTVVYCEATSVTAFQLYSKSPTAVTPVTLTEIIRPPIKAVVFNRSPVEPPLFHDDESSIERARAGRTDAPPPLE